jgi:hypothetical protein
MIFEHYTEDEREILEKLHQALFQLPAVRVGKIDYSPSFDGKKFDAEIELTIDNVSFTLEIEVKRSLFPRDVEGVIYRLARMKGRETLSHKGRVPMLAAASISLGAKEILRREKIGYFDTGGSMFIPARGAFTYVERPAPVVLKKAIRSIFTSKRAEVLQVLLNNPSAWYSGKMLADVSNASAATVSETLGGLERMSWIETRGQGPSKERRLSNARALLNEWQKFAEERPVQAKKYYVPDANAEQVAGKIETISHEIGAGYALTQEFAAQRYAPFLTSVPRVACRMQPSAAQELVSRIGARTVSEGANLSIIETKSEGELLLKEKRDGLWLANPVQVYLDLIGAGGRSKDMAGHLRQERLQF